MCVNLCKDTLISSILINCTQMYSLASHRETRGPMKYLYACPKWPPKGPASHCNAIHCNHRYSWPSNQGRTNKKSSTNHQESVLAQPFWPGTNSLANLNQCFMREREESKHIFGGGGLGNHGPDQRNFKRPKHGLGPWPKAKGKTI